MRHSHLLNYALYQAGWFACVLGAASHRPWTAPITLGLLRLSVSWAIALAVFSVVVRRDAEWSARAGPPTPQ